MPLFPSSAYYDPIPQSRKSTDSIALDTEHLEDSGQSQGFPQLSPSLQNTSSDADGDVEADSDSDFSVASRLLWNGQSPSRSSRWRGQRRRRRLRRESGCSVVSVKRWLQKLVRHPFFPTKPLSIIISLLLLALFVLATTFSLMYILNPDKAPVPWRIYCSIPSSSTLPPIKPIPAPDEIFTAQLPKGVDPISSPDLTTPTFPPDNLEDLPPAGVYLGIFSIDSAIERRMLIRTTWASHLRSRFGANDSDGGLGTSRTVVRFILGKPRSEWKRRVQLEAETYNDIVILPIKENMNSGKSHAYFTWAADNAWVPAPQSSHMVEKLSYTNESIPAPALAPHDPRSNETVSNWVRPDFVLKADDDTFIMLAELEARLRVQLDNALKSTNPEELSRRHDTSIEKKKTTTAVYESLPHSDPLIYFGYLVKNRFMAGETYGLSWALTRWVAAEPLLRGMVRGAEDKQTAKWMHLHPRAQEVRWASERCWIYDHPRAGTVYSHGFLFPSEASRVRHSIISLLRPIASVFGTADGANIVLPRPPTTYISPHTSPNDSVVYTLPPQQNSTSPSYAYSSVSRFGRRYKFPLADLTPKESIEALVEGSHMSKLMEDGPETAAQAWARRESHSQRYEGKRVGGTAIVHFIKRNEWFLETAMALLGDDVAGSIGSGGVV